MERRSFGSLEYENKKVKTRRQRFLERMEQLVPWEELEGRIAPVYPKPGRGRRRAGAAGARGDDRGLDHHQRALLNEEPRESSRPGDASDQEGPTVVLRDEAAHRQGRAVGAGAQRAHDGGERLRRDRGTSPGGRWRGRGVGRRHRLSGVTVLSIRRVSAANLPNYAARLERIASFRRASTLSAT